VTNWGDWERVRRQVALCGRVVNREDKPLGGARVTIIQGPKEFEAQAKGGLVAASARGDEKLRRDVTETKPDGIYFFMDLPGGEYTVAAEDPHGGGRGQSRGKVVRDKAGNIQRAVADIKLLSG